MRAHTAAGCPGTSVVPPPCLLATAVRHPDDLGDKLAFLRFDRLGDDVGETEFALGETPKREFRGDTKAVRVHFVDDAILDAGRVHAPGVDIAEKTIEQIGAEEIDDSVEDSARARLTADSAGHSQ